MRALDHREPGIVGTALTDDRLSADIIADGVHLSPEIVSLFLRCKGEERAVLITDAISATGMPDGKYRLGEVEVDVANGRCMRNGRLAGSILTLDRAVRNVMDFAGLRLEAAVRLATSNAARAAGLDCGALREGGDADLVVLSPGGDVMQCFAQGQPVIR
jgi:N-acetylglucosamine-6-phosphate deacetylase